MKAASLISTVLATLWFGILTLLHPAAAQVSQRIDLAIHKAGIAGVTISVEDREMTIRPVWPASVSHPPMSIAVRMPNYPAATVEFGKSAWINYGQWVGALRLAPTDPAVTVLLEAYSAGAHCCSLLRAMSSLGNKQLIVHEFPPAEGEIRADLPTDVDGDGIFDIVREDELVCGDNGQCAKRIAIYNIREGRVLDVTALPKFQTIVERYQKRLGEK